jgi:integrase/recombinase XerD
MFEQLFVNPHAIARHSTEPLLDERRRFLAHLKESGLPRVTLRWHSEMLLWVAETLRLADRPGEMISQDEINRKATDKQHRFSSVATRWLRYLG